MKNIRDDLKEISVHRHGYSDNKHTSAVDRFEASIYQIQDRRQGLFQPLLLL